MKFKKKIGVADYMLAIIFLLVTGPTMHGYLLFRGTTEK